MSAVSAPLKTGVLFISSAEDPGADTFIHTLIMRSLDRKRFDVHVAYSAGKPAARSAAHEVLTGIPDLHLTAANFGPSLTASNGVGRIAHIARSLMALPELLALAQYVRRHRITLLHATDRPRDAVACAVLGRLSGARSIIHAHVKCAEWIGRPVRTAMHHVDALIGVSEFVAQSLVDSGYSRDRTHAVLNAIDLPAWDYRAAASTVRHELGIPHAAPVIVSAARLFRGKGQDDVIRAMPELRREFPTLRLLVVGRDDLQAMPTSFMAELKSLVRELGVSEHVMFTGQRSDMPAVMAAADVFALPSFEEPFGLVFAEAMAMKKPVVAVNNGGTPEVVDHGKSGLLSEPGNQEELTANLRLLLRDGVLRARMGEFGRQRVESRFHAGRVAADVAALYDRVLRGNHDNPLVLADQGAI